MKTTKRLMAIALSICISLSAVIGLITPANAANVSATTFDSKLASFKAEKYAHNSIYQNNPNLTGGYECFGYANELAIYIWGSYPTNSMSAARVNDGWSVTYGGTAVDDLCVGDVVRYWYHSIFITGIDDDTIYYCHANSPAGTNRVTYDNSISRGDLKKRVSGRLLSGGTDKSGWVAHYMDSAISTTTCKHEYNNKGICTLCGEAYAPDVSSAKFSARTLKDINLKALPYAAQATTRHLTEDTVIAIVSSAVNHYGNEWYETADGDWLYSEDVVVMCRHQFKSYSEETHPHYIYHICSLCGLKETTADTAYHTECETCHPPVIPTKPSVPETVTPSVPVYQTWKNSDSRWSSVSLGSGTTIGNSGGLVVSLAIAMADCGATSESYTPADLVAALKAVGGLTSSGLLIWDKVSSAVPGFEEQSNVSMKSSSLSVAQKTEMIRQAIDNGYQVIVQIPKSSPWGLRYVVVDRVENGTVYMFDPNSSETDLFAAYGNYPNVAIPYAY